MKTMAKLRMAHASTHGARKPPGPTFFNISFWINSLFLIGRNEIDKSRQCLVILVVFITIHYYFYESFLLNLRGYPDSFLNFEQKCPVELSYPDSKSIYKCLMSC